MKYEIDNRDSNTTDIVVFDENDKEICSIRLTRKNVLELLKSFYMNLDTSNKEQNKELRKLYQEIIDTIFNDILESSFEVNEKMKVYEVVP